MDLKRIDLEDATRVYKTRFEGNVAHFYGKEPPPEYLIGDMLWEEFEDAEFLLGYEGDKPLGLAIYTGSIPDYDKSGVVAVKLYAILTDPDDEQRAAHFVNILFQLRARFRQAKGEYFTVEAAPYDVFTVEMLEATEFKLIAPFVLMKSESVDGDMECEVKPAQIFEPLADADTELPGADPYLGSIPSDLAVATFVREVENGNTYEVTRSGERLGYVCVVPDPGATMVFGGEPCGRLLYAYPWDTPELYEAARQITKFNVITTYAALTEPLLIEALETMGYRTIGAKLSFRLNLV